MYTIIFTHTYKKDIKLCRKKNLPEDELNKVITILSNGKELPAKYRDHALKGNYKGFRECHIRPNWLLVYLKDKEKLILTLIRTGSHSDLFE